MTTPHDPDIRLPGVLKRSSQGETPIRALFTAEHSPRLIKGDVIRHVRQIQGKLDAAEQEAEAVIARAHEEAAALRQRAIDEARVEVTQEMCSALEHARGEYDRLMANSEEDIIALAIQVAERIIHQKITMDPQTLKHILKGSLEIVRDRRQITVLVHPDDLELMQSWRAELLEHVETTALFFAASDEVERGDCLIDTEAGRVDARLSIQLDNFKRALTS